MTVFGYNTVIVITLNIKLFSFKNNRNSQWRCSLKEGVPKNFPCNFIKKRLQHRYFPVKLAKFLRTSIFANICKKLLLQDNIEKTIHLFLSQNQDFIIITIAFEALTLFRMGGRQKGPRTSFSPATSTNVRIRPKTLGLFVLIFLRHQ